MEEDQHQEALAWSGAVSWPVKSLVERAESTEEQLWRSEVEALRTLLWQRRLWLVEALDALMEEAGLLNQAARWLCNTLAAGRKVLVAGNGGSAAQAQHFAAELVGRFKRERRPYPVVALTSDSATLTALANDYGYAAAFARQIQALGQPGDLLLALSTSGESENLLQAALLARQQGVFVLALTGERESRLETLADLTLRMPGGTEPARTQELQLLLIHVLCDLTEAQLCLRERHRALRMEAPEGL
ncbi:D-sedoheptulose-7-phosphate isomerase [Thermogemmatispora onikobensis]|uniref:D-sedoheptulose-7-phosphate isomerase n=1 Tax=Thermogemmatispora onikobensis TaxID=732234 RepID=UPI000A670069|nr:SIS domain-containing protein [Thermogemmatispora onikobensis]